MLTVLSGMRQWIGMPAFGALLAVRERERAQRAYDSQLLWNIGAQLWTLRTGAAWPVPDYFTLFPPRRLGEEHTGAGILRHILQGLEGGVSHG